MMADQRVLPRLFVASSVEGLDVAYNLQQELEHDAEVTVWSQGVFRPTRTTLDELMRVLNDFDAAAFVFRPDDVLSMREEAADVVRDNVIFEAGLFIGRLGTERCFLVVPRDTNLHLPTDLLGVAPLSYDPKRRDGNLRAALGPPAHDIRKALRGLLNPQVHQRGPAQVSQGEVRVWLREEVERNRDELQRLGNTIRRDLKQAEAAHGYDHLPLDTVHLSLNWSDGVWAIERGMNTGGIIDTERNILGQLYATAPEIENYLRTIVLLRERLHAEVFTLQSQATGAAGHLRIIEPLVKVQSAFKARILNELAPAVLKRIDDAYKLGNPLD